jgi:ATP-binding cassette, subfamily D (ALD), member 2
MHLALQILLVIH